MAANEASDYRSFLIRRILAAGIDIILGILALLVGFVSASALARWVYGSGFSSPQDGSEAWYDGFWLVIPALLPGALVFYYNGIGKRRRTQSIGMRLFVAIAALFPPPPTRNVLPSSIRSVRNRS